MNKIVNLCKQYGFVFQGSEIYGGLANTWDYGPLGVELKNNVKKCWWKKFVQESKHSYGVDAAILMNPRVWEASGHTTAFSDPLIDCKNCKARHRADNLISAFSDETNPDKMTNAEMDEFIATHKINCPRCGKSEFTNIRNFNLMFETSRGTTEGSKNEVYLRPETAQGEFVNFQNVQKSMRTKLPFGIGQIGKAFRNEITPGNFTFRTIEFEQMEHQLFCKEGTDGEFYQQYKQKAHQFLLDIGIDEQHIRFHDHDKLAHYAKAACDIEFLFPMGWSELWGTHNRTNYDLTRHQEFSGKSMEYLDPENNEKIIPYIVESSVGCDRMVLAILIDSYKQETASNGTVREILNLNPAIAPYKAAILPLSKRDHSEKACEIHAQLVKAFPTAYDESGSIGKRYYRQDVTGTPFCITVDEQTINNNTVTVRDRNTTEQIVLSVDQIEQYVSDRIKF